MMWKVHGVFMTVHFHTFFIAIILIAKTGKSSGITGPHIPLGCALGNPLGQHFTCTSALGNTKGKYTGFERVLYSRHRTN